jgi:hypothetical protein
MNLSLWDNLLWQSALDGPFAFCPHHRMRLDLFNPTHNMSGAQAGHLSTPHVLRCPKDGATFSVPDRNFRTYQRHFTAALESLDLKDAQIVDLDGYQIPIAKAEPPAKDKEYWVQARINDTKRGKQIVVYAGKRDTKDKAQIFIDPEHDKITFDQNDMHPNDVFFRLEGQFRSGGKTTLQRTEDT